VLASGAWAINTQLGEILAWPDCQQQARYSAASSSAALLLACVAAIASWRATRRVQVKARLTALSGFIGAMSALSALIFIFALSMQAIASLVLSGCER